MALLTKHIELDICPSAHSHSVASPALIGSRVPGFDSFYREPHVKLGFFSSPWRNVELIPEDLVFPWATKLNTNHILIRMNSIRKRCRNTLADSGFKTCNPQHYTVFNMDWSTDIGIEITVEFFYVYISQSLVWSSLYQKFGATY